MLHVRAVVACTIFLFSASPWEEPSRIRLLVVGDMNLGRHVGQMLLRDSLDYPFASVSGVFAQYDVVMGNLESQITDQNGETQHPGDRFIFCAPPQAGKSLERAGVRLVSTANNHAFDYTMRGLRETVEYLNEAGIAFAGTSVDSVGTFPPVLINRNGILVGFLAYTQFVNRKKGWSGHISIFDELRVRSEISALKKTADFIIVSYHGGDEYKDRPNKRTLMQMRTLIDAGADIVLGHHPHVPQGVECYKGKWIFYSLGNFVFYQPQREWTQKGIAVSLVLRKRDFQTEIEEMEILPLSAGFQPSFSVTQAERALIEGRFRKLSDASVMRKDTTFVVTESIVAE